MFEFHLMILFLKTALLPALALVKRLGDLQAFLVEPSCLEFDPNNSKVVLRPKTAYNPKVLTTPYRVQVASLLARQTMSSHCTHCVLSSDSGDPFSC